MRFKPEATYGNNAGLDAARAALEPIKKKYPDISYADLYTYVGVIALLCPRHRVIECKEHVQWIVQRRKNGGAERPWRAVGYFRTRDALIQACATLCGRIDPAAMAILVALPSHFGGAS